MNDLEKLPSFRFARALLSGLPIWAEDEPFTDIMSRVEFSLAPWPRCYQLYKLALNAKNIDGDIAEIGVYKGGTARILTEVIEGTGKNIYLFDTFEGMPETDADKDLHKKGDFADVTIDGVNKQLEGLDGYTLVPGYFPDTADIIENKTFCMVHIDVDIYQSVIDCCEYFYNKVNTGGVIVFDDYGSKTCPGAKLAVDEFFATKKEVPVYTPTGQAFVIKQD